MKKQWSKPGILAVVPASSAEVKKLAFSNAEGLDVSANFNFGPSS